MTIEKCYKCLGDIAEAQAAQHGLHEKCFNEWFGLITTEDFSNIIVRSSSSGNKKKTDEQFRKNSSFFHGKFKKYSATLAGVSYILKVKEHNFPELPATEYLCNQMAKHLKIDVPPFFFIRFEGKVETFVSRNFMQDYEPANLVHIYNYLEGEQKYNCKNLIDIIENKTGRLSDIECFIELCLFDSLIGNNDRHGRNLGLIQTKKGISLSPVYDNPSYLGVEEYDLLAAQIEPAGSIATSKSEEPKMEHYVEEFFSLGHGEIVLKFNARVKIEELFALVEKSFISEKRKKSLKTLIERRYKELTNGIAKQTRP